MYLSAMAYPKRTVQLRRGDQSTLEAWVRSRTIPQRMAERAKVLLASADGASVRDVAAEIGVSIPTVRSWLSRYEAEGLTGLERDRPRSGRPKQVNAEVEAEIVRRTVDTMPPSGTHWSTRIMAAEMGVHQTTISRIWRANGLKPHLVRHFKLSNDPEFTKKLRDVVGLYVDPPAHAVVFSVDEKSQIQALDRTQPGLPLKKGRAGTMTHDYKRHGTTTLFAALDVATGEVLHECMDRHRHQEFLRFARQVVRTVDPKLDVHFILDNYATHKHSKVRAWLEKNPRVHFHFVPTYASWLNLVERFFSELTTRQLRRLAVNSVAELIDRITEYIEHRNRDPKPFTWTASVQSILRKVAKAKKTLASQH